MNVLVLLNGHNLRRQPADLAERMCAAVRGAGHGCRVEVSRSAEHMLALFGSAAEVGVDAILVGGGDGTLHMAVNHPLAPKVVLGVLPMGTINAFARSAEMPHSDAMAGLRSLLRGGPSEGRCGIVGGRRFACFASWGFDARVVHRNSSALKRRIGALSYVATGVAQLARWRANQVVGAVRADGETLRATSVLVSKIDNYAGARAFRVGAADPAFDVALSPSDDPISALAFWANVVAIRRPLRGTRRMHGVRAVQWSSRRPTHVQIDGEAVDIPDAARFDIGIDLTPQRYWLP